MRCGLISIYPPPNYTHYGKSGVASYTKNLVTSFPKDCKIIVFANKFENSERLIETENHIKVLYCWSKNFLFPFEIFNKVFKNRKNIDVIHIQHEFFIYGASKFSSILFIIMIFMLKLLNKPIIVTLHHGFLKPSQINKYTLDNLGVRIVPIVLLLGFKVFFRLVSFIASYIIVHEKYFKNILTEYYDVPQDKIVVVPHGVEDNIIKINQEQAKTFLNLRGYKVILYFGYLSKFKGVDLLVESFQYLKDINKYVLLIAGGEHPRLRGDKKYEEFLHNLKEKAKQLSKNILFTGFVPDEKLPIYFSAADVVVLPYKIVFSSSGPLSLSIAYEKPFLVSDAFKDVIELREVVFKNPKELAEKINLIISSGTFRYKLLKYIKALKNQRKWDEISKKHLRIYESVLEW